jgi:hypothetical protein
LALRAYFRRSASIPSGTAAIFDIGSAIRNNPLLPRASRYSARLWPHRQRMPGGLRAEPLWLNILALDDAAELRVTGRVKTAITRGIDAYADNGDQLIVLSWDRI